MFIFLNESLFSHLFDSISVDSRIEPNSIELCLAIQISISITFVLKKIRSAVALLKFW